MDCYWRGGTQLKPLQLGTLVVPFCPFYSGVSLIKLNSRKKGTLLNGLLGNLDNKHVLEVLGFRF